MIISGNECGDNTKGNWVYFGYSKKKNLVYIGTTMQKPSDRFRWHRHNGKNLKFKVFKNCATDSEMFDLELKLILEKKPVLNKKTKRHNNNKRLTQVELNSRVGDSEWCQCCLKRRVSKGYSKCMYCSNDRL